MTITLRPVTAAIALLAVGVLLGLAIGGLTRASSAPSAEKSAGSNKQVISKLSSLQSQVRSIQSQVRSLDSDVFAISLETNDIDDAASSAYGACRAVGGTGCRP